MLLRLLEALHRGLRRLRRAPRRAARLPVPVIVVGNLVAGGSGKTPLVIALVQRLLREGRRPGVLSRGYGRRGRGLRLADVGADPREVGDEPALIAQACRVPVAVSADRIEAAAALLARGCDVLVSDDGLQHARLPRDIEIEVVDAERGYGNGRLLPAGPLREPAGRAVDLRVVNGVGEGIEGYPMRLELGEPVALVDGATVSWDALRGRDCLAVAGIGNPARFFAALGALGLRIEARAFPDHHAYSPDELAFAAGRTLLMTDKDAIKCRAFARPGWYRVPAAAALPEAFFQQVLKRISHA